MVLFSVSLLGTCPVAEIIGYQPDELKPRSIQATRGPEPFDDVQFEQINE